MVSKEVKIRYEILDNEYLFNEESIIDSKYYKLIIQPFLAGMGFGLDKVLEKISTQGISWGKYCVYSVLKGITYMV